MNANAYNEGRTPGVPQRNEARKPANQKAKAPSKIVSAAWLVPAALLLLSAIPLAAGAFRLTDVSHLQ